MQRNALYKCLFKCVPINVCMCVSLSVFVLFVYIHNKKATKPINIVTLLLFSDALKSYPKMMEILVNILILKSESRFLQQGGGGGNFQIK